MKLNPVFELGMKDLEFVKMCQIDTNMTLKKYEELGPNSHL
jgi:hypothetical protein